MWLMQKVRWSLLKPSQFHPCLSPNPLDLYRIEEGGSPRSNTPELSHCDSLSVQRGGTRDMSTEFI